MCPFCSGQSHVNVTSSGRVGIAEWTGFSCFFFYYVFKHLFIFERERETARRRGRENRKQAPGSELSAQSLTWVSNPRTARS